MEAIGDSISRFLFDDLKDGGFRRTRQSQQTFIPASGYVSESIPEIPEVVEVEPEDISGQGVPLKVSTERDVLSKVFSYNGDTLKLNDHRLKPSSQLDFARRLTYVFLYAHLLDGRELVSRGVLNTLLRDAAVFDSNISKWINRSADLEKKDGKLGLLIPGKEKAQAILKELEDPLVEAEWSYESRKSVHARKQGRSSIVASEKNGARGNRQSPIDAKVSAWFTAWNEGEGKCLELFSVLNGRAKADQALIGLWAIRKVTDDANIMISKMELAEFLLRAGSTKVDGRTLEAHLVKSAMAFVIRDKSSFRLNPGGDRYVEQMVQGFQDASNSNEIGDNS